MPRPMTDEMLAAAAGGRPHTLEVVGGVRRLLALAGVTDVELHPVEILRLRELREAARIATAAAEKLLAAGPLPAHECEVDEAGKVKRNPRCPYGCRYDSPRIEVE